MNDNIHKVWGERRRILKNDLVEIDHLVIKKDHCCSVHNHKHKSNKFYIVSGKCKIKTELGDVILGPNEHFDVHPPIKHQFIALEDTVMVECAYLKIDENDVAGDLIYPSENGKTVTGSILKIKYLKRGRDKNF